MNPLRIAVMGAGLIGMRHIQTILSMPQTADLVAVADPLADPAALALGNAAWFRDAREMLETARPEAVVIATPNALHLQHGLACSERGIHFLMEKPVTTTLDEAETLVAAIRRSGVKTLAGHHRRYLAAIQDAKSIITGGSLGKLVAVSVVWATRKPDDYFKTTWRTQPGGGPILINAIHEIDMLRHLCGEIASVSGVTSNAMRGFAVEDSAAALLRFDNGCLGTLICTDAGFSPWTIEQGSQENSAFPHSEQSAYRLIGTEGSLELPVLRSWSAQRPGDIGWNRPIVGTNLQARHHDPYKEQLAHFQRLIRQDEKPVVSVEDGARTLAATLAVAQSNDTAQPCTPHRFQ